uniref:Uncharacterized protein n=1 Tax=Rhizophora mucronata TaxID=61149 RepID=A0A2P2PPG4_RHIMU
MSRLHKNLPLTWNQLSIINRSNLPLYFHNSTSLLTAILSSQA